MIRRATLLRCSQENLERFAKWLKIEFEQSSKEDNEDSAKAKLVELIYWKIMYP